jgi:hypothetical protein
MNSLKSHVRKRGSMTELIKWIIAGINWNKIGLWFSAVFLQANVMYPGLNAEKMAASWKDGTFMFNLGIVIVTLITTRAAVKVNGFRKKKLQSQKGSEANE